LHPNDQSLICSIAALAAEAALESFLASMISAPLFYTFGLKYVSYQALSIDPAILLPAAVTLVRSGTIVGEWFPQIQNFSISPTAAPTLSAT